MSTLKEQGECSKEPLLAQTFSSNVTKSAQRCIFSGNSNVDQHSPASSSDCQSVELGDPAEFSSFSKTVCRAIANHAVPSASTLSESNTPTHVDANIVCTCGPNDEGQIHQSGLSLASVVTIGHLAALRGFSTHPDGGAVAIGSFSLGGALANYEHCTTDSDTTSYAGPICRICHLPAEEQRPLISPCRCSGTLQFIHTACLTKWLEISMRKHRNRGLPRCELCNFQYVRRKRFTTQSLRWPKVSRRDKILHVTFVLSFLLMIVCAVATVLCFISDREQSGYVKHSLDAGADPMSKLRDDSNKNSRIASKKLLDEEAFLVQRKIEQIHRSIGSQMIYSSGGGAGSGGSSNRPLHMTKKNSSLSSEETVTLTCGVLFFLSFFVAMTVQIKSRHTIYQLLVKFLMLNREWEIRDYDRARDSEWPAISRSAFLAAAVAQTRGSAGNFSDLGLTEFSAVVSAVPAATATAAATAMAPISSLQMCDSTV